ncbi:ankyrin [Cystobasidium minutum MCA 4210]|uniref:ankyrin n=1 Tax=Cystobasidium minutum MCA 4210 TaxID=1397322 RepID=UPI0034CDDFC3|eukprot:jgi/Rhomi1/16855/CE16854_1861
MTDSQDTSDGASPYELLLYAAKTDSEDIAKDALSKVGDDVNKKDGLGLAAIHYATKAPSPDVLELLLDFEKTDVDLPEKRDGDTPLHLAVRIQNEGARSWTVQTLLEAGADPRIRNKHKELPIESLPADSPLREDIRRAEADLAMESSDLVNDDEGGDESGGSSGEE